MKYSSDPLLVSIRCTVYNHENYLRQTLDGFVNQQTNFRFEAIVHDDCSTDGSAAIINEYADKYPDIIKPIFETENLWSKHDGSIGKILNENCVGKYIAICEGDDYWIDSHKLQKQVDFLESHPDYSFSHTGFRIYNESNADFEDCSEIIKRNLETGEDQIDFEILNANRYRIQTMTVLYRRSAYLDIIPWLDKIRNKFLMGDTQLWIYLHKKGQIHFLPDVTAVYRVHLGSACRPKLKKDACRFALSCCELALFMTNDIHVTPKQGRYLQKKYLKALLLYKFEDPAYQPFITVTYPNTLDYRLFCIFSSRWLLPVCRYSYNVIVKLKEQMHKF